MKGETKRRRCFAVILCAALVLACLSLPAGTQKAYADDEESETYTYTYEGHTLSYVIEDEEVTITGCADEDADTTVTELVIPEEIDGLSVTAIEGSAFMDYTALTQITLPDTITEMGTSVFNGCESLTSIDLPDGITSIGRRTFRNCTSLESVDFPDSLKEIGMYAFYNCSSLEEVLFPDNLAVIYEQAFYNCTAVTYIRLPAVEVGIRNGNFNQSTKVETVEYAEGAERPYTSDGWQDGTSFVSSAKTLILPSTLTSITTGGEGYSGSISNDYFDAFSSLEEIVFPNGHEDYTTYGGAIYDTDLETLYIVPHGLSEYEIADTCTTIAYGAFYDCNQMTTIEIPASVTTLESRAINNCSGLKTLQIPKTVTSLANGAVSGCSALTYFTYYTDGMYCVFTDEDDADHITQLEIFDDDESAVEVTSDIFDVFINTSGNDMNNNSSVSTAETNMQTIIFPASTESIEVSMFETMTSLEAIVADADNSTYYTENGILYQYTDGEVSDEGNAALSLIRYPIALGYVELADNIVSIGERAFCGCTTIKNLEFENTLTEVGTRAFYRCTDLTVIFYEGLTTIGDEAFMNCLDSVILVPESLTSIGTDAFYTADQSLTLYCYEGSYAEEYAIANDVVYADRLTSGLDDADLNSTEDTEETGTDTEETGTDAEETGTDTEETGTDAEDDGSGTDETGTDTEDAASGTGDSDSGDAKNNSGDSGAAVGKTVTVGNAVYKVTSKTAVTYVKSTKKNASKVTIPATVKINGKSYKVTAVKASAFAKNKKLKTVVIGKNVKTIGKKAFYNCKNLKKITFKGKNVKKIGTKAFKGTAKKAVVKVPKAKKTAYKKLLKKAGLSAKAKIK